MAVPLRKSIDAGSTPRISGSAHFFRGWRVAGVSAAGEDHVHAPDPMPCQDAFQYGRVGNLLWGAVADGVGSERLSQYGAGFAVEAVGDFVANHAAELEGHDGVDFAADAASKVARYCRGRIVEQASGLGVPDRELATTVQVVICHFGRSRMLYLAVGNGNCLVRKKDGSAEALGYRRDEPDLGTPSLGVERHLDYLFSASLDLRDVAGFVLISDGLDRLFVQKGKQSGREAVSEKNVAAVIDTLLQVDSEIDSVNRFGQLIMNPQFRDEMRDDKTMLVFARTDEKTDPGPRTTPSQPQVFDPPMPDPPSPVRAGPAGPARQRAMLYGPAILVIVLIILTLEILQLAGAFPVRGSSAGDSDGNNNAASASDNSADNTNASVEPSAAAAMNDAVDASPARRAPPPNLPRPKPPKGRTPKPAANADPGVEENKDRAPEPVPAETALPKPEA